MYSFVDLEKKVKSGLMCHADLGCENCPYNGIDYEDWDELSLPCVSKLCCDAVHLFDHYADAFAHLDIMYHNCRVERDKIQSELNGWRFSFEVLKDLLKEEGEEQEF